MRRTLFSLALAVALSPVSATAQTVDEIVAKHITAKGGAEKLQALRSIKATGTFSIQDLTFPITIHRRYPNLFHLAVDAQGTEIVQAFDGEMAWWISPLNGITKAAPMPEGEAFGMRLQADLYGLLYDYAAKGRSVELLGREKLEEGKADKLKVTLNDGGELVLFLDAKDHLERKLVVDLEIGGTVQAVEVFFKDYRPVAGVAWPHHQITVADGGVARAELKLDTVEANVDIGEDLFRMPGQQADPELSVTEILRRHSAARGAEATRSVTSLKATGTVVAQGFEVPMVLYFKRPRSFRVDVDLQGLEMVQAFDGEVAWRVSPMEGITEPEELPADVGAAVETFSDFVWGLLAQARESELDVRLAGIDKVDNHEVYHLEVKTPADSGAQEARHVFLGGEDFLEHKLSFDVAESKVEAFLGDYRTVAGAQLPHSIRSQLGPIQFEMKIKDVEVDADLEDTLFAMPAKTVTAPAEGQQK